MTRNENEDSRDIREASRRHSVLRQKSKLMQMVGSDIPVSLILSLIVARFISSNIPASMRSGELEFRKYFPSYFADANKEIAFPNNDFSSDVQELIRFECNPWQIPTVSPEVGFKDTGVKSSYVRIERMKATQMLFAVGLISIQVTVDFDHREAGISSISSQRLTFPLLGSARSRHALRTSTCQDPPVPLPSVDSATVFSRYTGLSSKPKEDILSINIRRRKRPKSNDARFYLFFSDLYTRNGSLAVLAICASRNADDNYYRPLYLQFEFSSSSYLGGPFSLPYALRASVGYCDIGYHTGRSTMRIIDVIWSQERETGMRFHSCYDCGRSCLCIMVEIQLGC